MPDLTDLSENDLAVIAVAVFQHDDMGEQTHVLEQIGGLLDIDAVYGEGYDTTVFRVSNVKLGVIDEHDVPDAQARILEALDNIGVSNDVQACVEHGLYGPALALLSVSEGRDAEGAADTIRTILKQHGHDDPTGVQR